MMHGRRAVIVALAATLAAAPILREASFEASGQGVVTPPVDLTPLAVRLGPVVVNITSFVNVTVHNRGPSEAQRAQIRLFWNDNNTCFLEPTNPAVGDCPATFLTPGPVPPGGNASANLSLTFPHARRGTGVLIVRVEPIAASDTNTTNDTAHIPVFVRHYDFNFTLEPHRPNDTLAKEARPNETAAFRLEVNNLGNVDDSYNVTFDRHNGTERVNETWRFRTSADVFNLTAAGPADDAGGKERLLLLVTPGASATNRSAAEGIRVIVESKGFFDARITPHDPSLPLCGHPHRVIVCLDPPVVRINDTTDPRARRLLVERPAPAFFVDPGRRSETIMRVTNL
ncbi:MAG: hypothetical protein ACT4PT_01820, partial [Methanobacteriota archaeon]